MSETATARDVFITGLRNQHAVENQAVELLSRQVERLENYPEMSERMRQHIEESRAQAQRLEELLGQLGASHSGLKDTVTSILGNMAAIGHTLAKDEVVKNTLANFAFEHFEIAAYRSLLSLTDLAGAASADTALRQSLSEEEAMAEWLDAHIAPTTQRYVARVAAGEKAGV